MHHGTGRTIGLAAMGAVTLASAVAASITIWLMVAEPMTVATAIATHQAMPLVQAVRAILSSFLASVARSL